MDTSEKAPASDSNPQAKSEATTHLKAEGPTPVENLSNEGRSPEADATAEERATSGGTSSDEADISTTSVSAEITEATGGSQGDHPQTGSPEAPVDDASDESQAPVNAE